jgi:hypothetical protein
MAAPLRGTGGFTTPNTEVDVTDIQAGTPTSGASGSTPRQAAGQAAGAAGQAARDVAETAKDQARDVGQEARAQARNVAADVRDRVGEQARNQNDRLVDGIRRMADELDSMRGDRQESPAATVVNRVAEGGRQVADYLARKGPEGVLDEVQDFARRRPGAFLATALAAGFVVGRLGKGVINAGSAGPAGKPRSDAFISDVPRLDPEPSYPTVGYPDSTVEPAGPRATPAATPPVTTTTEYAATGTGTPVPTDTQPTISDGPR